MAPPKPVALAPEGNYVFSTPLGEGTFGTVVKATHKIAKEHVAVKVLEKKRMLQADEIEVRATPRAARKIARAPPRPPLTSSASPRSASAARSRSSSCSSTRTSCGSGRSCTRRSGSFS